MHATTKAQTAKANAAAETFTDAEGDSGQLAQVLAALAGLTNKFAGVEATVSDLAARQVALDCRTSRRRTRPQPTDLGL